MSETSYLIISFIITIFAYMIVPVIYVIKNGKQPTKIAREIAVVNSVIIFILFQMIRIYTDSLDKVNIVPALFYGYINFALLNEGKKNKTISINGEDVDANSLTENKEDKKE